VIQRFKAVAGFLAAASLLSGSAFAFAPEFDSDLPTVIITDSLTTGTAGSAYDNNGAAAATTEHVYRFTKAIDLLDYMDLLGNDPNNTKLLFNEFDDFSDTTPNTQHTLMINGLTAFATGVNDHPTEADVTASGIALTARYVDGGLDFRNIDFSGSNEAVNAGFNNIGDVTGHDILASDQQRVVHLYVRGDTDSTLAHKDFLVITSHTGLDSLGSPVITSVFEAPIFEQDLLDGWTGGATGDFFLVPSSGTTYDIIGSAAATSGFTLTPSTSPTGASQQTVGIAATDAQTGFARWSKIVGNMSANELYRLRANVYSPNINSNETFRLGLGNAIDAGQSLVQFDDTSGLGAGSFPDMPSDANTELRVYLEPETTISNGEVVAEVLVLSNTGSVTSAGGGQDFVVDEIILDRTTDGLASLGTGSVVINQGRAIASESDPFVDPVPSPTAFVTTGATAGQTWLFNAGLNSSNQETFSSAGGGLTVNFPASSGVAPPDFPTLALQDANAVQPWLGGAFQVDSGKLYQVDVWASSTAAQSVANSRPDLRIDISMNAGFSAHLVKDLSPVNFSSAPINGVTTTPRAYTLFFEPQGEAGTVEASLALRLMSIGKSFPTASPVTIDRVTIREYDVPQ
jgi:hypothetical protein